MKERLLTLVFLVVTQVLCSNLWAQSDPPLRIELPTAQDAEDYHFSLMGKDGVLVFYEGLQLNKDTTEWVLMQYDTNLQKQCAFNIHLPPQASFRQSFFNQGKLYLLYQEVVGKKESPRTFISVVDVTAKTEQLHVIQNLPKFEGARLKAVDGYAVFSFIYSDTYWIYFYDTHTENLHSFIVPNAAIISEQFVEIDSLNQKFLLGLGVLYGSKVAMLSVFETNYGGQLLKQAPLPIYEDFYYNTARLKIIDSSHTIIMGTYNLSSSRKSGFYHSGVYTLTYDNSTMGYPEFYNYTNLQKKDTLKNGKVKQQSLDLQMLVGDIVSNDSCYTLITEVYYPEYNYTSSYYDNSSYYYGGTYNPPTTTFVGYRYVNAYVTCFNRKGELLWDNYFPFNNIVTRRLANRMSLYYTPFGTAIFYPYNSNLTCCLINGYEIVENTETVPIECLHKKDVVEYSRDVNMYNWYDNKFVITGYQQINNNSKSVKGKRYVFFINKLEYR